ncbi:hypothetical protein LEP1GSC192_3416 [Leptospira sp. B5-022]|nr:hypothetical protein LEP1GSC192_3416 [Leptospira sp. B5-022]
MNGIPTNSRNKGEEDLLFDMLFFVCFLFLGFTVLLSA